MIADQTIDRLAFARIVLERVGSALLIVTAALLPLVFIPGFDDGYALPKALLLRGAGIVLALVFLVYLAIGGHFVGHVDRRIDGSLVAFAGFVTISAIVSVDVSQSALGEPFQYQGLVAVALYLGAFYAARLFLRTPERFRALSLAQLAVGGVVAGYAIAQSLGFDPFWSGPVDARPISSIGQANDLAAYLDLVIVLALCLWIESDARTRLAVALVIALSMIGLGLTMSRGGYLGLIGGAAVIVACRPPRLSMATVRLVARRSAVIMLVAAVALVISAPALFRVAERLTATFDVQEASARMHMESWQIGVAIALDHPVLGTGPETFPLVFDDYLKGVIPEDRIDHFRRFRLESPHNGWIGVAAESGIPALIALIAFMAAVASACAHSVSSGSTRSRTIVLAVLAALAVHAITTSFKTPETSTSLLVWVVAGSGLAASGALARRAPYRAVSLSRHGHGSSRSSEYISTSL